MSSSALGAPGCCWFATVEKTAYAPLRASSRVPVAIVGGGIVGLTAAWVLAREGVPVTLLEARRIGRQVTGRSTAKVTSQHALIYRHLIARLGRERAALYAGANATAVDTLCNWVDELAIECDLERRRAYAFTRREARRKALHGEAEAARALGLDARVVEPAPLPFSNVGAVRFDNQAQFNPARYLVGIARAIVAHGGHVFEDSRVTEIKRAKRWKLTIGRHRVEAEHVLLATNLPIGGPVPFDTMTRPRCHIAMAFRSVPEGTLDGMFIEVDRPTHSLRMGRDDRGPLLIALGPAFQTGHDGDVERRFRQLERWVRANVPAGDAAWHWVNEDYDTPDRVPFAGHLGRKAAGLYVATGFNGWGISNGTAAGISIADQVLGRDNPWTVLYDPVRRAPKRFNRGGDSQSVVRELAEIPPDGGGVIKQGKRSIAVWKSSDGKAHALSASCTHMGCIVTWNNASATWDCPCHGSIFARDGEVLHGPATQPLAAAKLPSLRPTRKPARKTRAKRR